MSGAREIAICDRCEQELPEEILARVRFPMGGELVDADLVSSGIFGERVLVRFADGSGRSAPAAAEVTARPLLEARRAVVAAARPEYRRLTACDRAFAAPRSASMRDDVAHFVALLRQRLGPEECAVLFDIVNRGLEYALLSELQATGPIPEIVEPRLEESDERDR